MTINQLIKRRRTQNTKKSNTPTLNGTQFRSGICIRTYVTTPKNPNSALRTVAKVKLYNRKEIIAYISGESHNLQEHSAVIVRGDCVKNLPEVRYHLVISLLDLKYVEGRKNSRSKYGTNIMTLSKNNNVGYQNSNPSISCDKYSLSINSKRLNTYNCHFICFWSNQSNKQTLFQH
ncbi:30S ribosomal protein S12 [Candidatus Hodgkinia cicadicola]|uniref:30S ribosomal protein S12 n=1 Tax=Candidatus Hodgkinia cicadicola TaxID=573658 RepID=A0ABX4MHQ3_9HYPH|nr:30S ribosomal protein S12 [Candidatus Hodgkinia cicadicola]